MINVITDFNSRVKEVESYFSFLEKLITKNPKLYYSSNKTRQLQPIDAELVKILKANGFLLLYNLVESTIKNSIDAIYDELGRNNVSFNTIKQGFKKVVLKNLKGTSSDDFLLNLNDIAIEIIKKSYASDNSISGNLDAKKIRELASIYGFSEKIHKNAKGGNKLLTVKTNRNSLAHGNVTFSDCGKNYTIQDLLEIKREVIIYIRGILSNINGYLNRNEYLA